MTVRCGRCETEWPLRPGDRECPNCGCQWIKGGKRVQEAAEAMASGDDVRMTNDLATAEDAR